MKWMNLEPVIQREVNQKEKDKYHIKACIQNLHANQNLQGRNKDVDVENKLVNTVGEEENGLTRESTADVYTLSHVKQLVGNCCIIQGALTGTL